MTEFLLGKVSPAGGDQCVVCNSGRTYRIKGLDPVNRHFTICVDCLAGKICEQIKGGLCESKGIAIKTEPDSKTVPMPKVEPAKAT